MVQVQVQVVPSGKMAKTGTSSDKCCICGEPHRIDACDMVRLKPVLPDRPLPPRAMLTLPDGLAVDRLSDSTRTVRSLRRLDKGTRFGPFRARKTCSPLPSIDFPLKIFSEEEEEDELAECYLDTTDEDECNWMMYVATACDVDEQNLVCYQDDGELYYVAVRDLDEGDHLKVWYSPYYAMRMNKALLGGSGQEECPPVTSDTATVEDLVERRNVTSRRAWCCKFCGKAEAKVTDFARHLTQHYELKLRRVCEVCSASFSSRKGLQKHVRIVHPTPIVIETPKNPHPIIEPNHNIPEPPPTTTRDPLLLQTVSENSCLVLGASGSGGGLGCLDNDSSSLNVDDSILLDRRLEHFDFELRNETDAEQLVCDVCLKTFQKPKQLVLHLQGHTGRYACLECNKVFTRKENFDHHPCRSFYKLKCPECDRPFLQAKHLREHVAYAHLRRFTCERCGVRLRGRKTVAEHVCAADRPKAIRCESCSATFATKSNLRSHERTVHREAATGGGFTCPLCLKRLNNWNSYRKHERLHGEKSFECDECGKRFARMDVLRDHVAAKHQKSPVACESCGKTFATRRLLQRHLLTHSDVKPHRCADCPMSFRTRSNLLRHLRTTHVSVKLNGSSLGDGAFECPKCAARLKSRHSLLRHVRRAHPGYDHPTTTTTRRRRGKKGCAVIETTDAAAQQPECADELELELRRTIERIDFDAAGRDVDIEIDKLLNDPVNIDSLLSESNDRLVESLLEIAGSAQALSMPDLNVGN